MNSELACASKHFYTNTRAFLNTISVISETWSFILQWLGTNRVVQAKDSTHNGFRELAGCGFPFLQQRWEYRTGVIAQLGLNHCDVPHSAIEGAGKKNSVKVKKTKTMLGPKGLIV